MTSLMTPSPSETIEKTLNIFDPSSRGILVGTSAIHWVLSARDCKSNDLPLNDVDILVTQEDLGLIRNEVLENKCGRITSQREGRIIVIPSYISKLLGAISLDVMTDSNSYDSPLVHTKFNGRVFARDIKLEQYITETEGRRHLTLPFIFWWKAAIGRSSDVSTNQKGLKIMLESGSFFANEYYAIARAIELGSSGYDMDGHFIYSSDPQESAEQEKNIPPIYLGARKRT